MRAVSGAAAAALLLTFGGCLLDPSGDEPGYPSEHAAVIPAGDAGCPSSCDIRGGYALGAAGGSVFLVDCAGEELAFTAVVGDTVLDVALGDGWALALLSDSIIPVSLSTGQVSEGTGLPARGVAVAAEAGKVMAMCVDGTIVVVQEGSWASPALVRSELAGCTAMAADQAGTAMFVDDPEDSGVARIDVGTGRMTAQADVYGSVMDLEQAGSGFCAAVEGGNELWVLGPWCTLLFLLTFPQEPDCGAAMPDNSFFFAGCDGIGLVVCSQSGEQVLIDESFQDVEDIALSADYALIASASDSSFTLLRR